MQLQKQRGQGLGGQLGVFAVLALEQQYLGENDRSAQPRAVCLGRTGRGDHLEVIPGMLTRVEAEQDFGNVEVL